MSENLRALFVGETWTAWGVLAPEWKYCTGVRPSGDRGSVERRLAKYANGRKGKYRVAVYIRDDERTSVVSPPDPVCKRKRGAR